QCHCSITPPHPPALHPLSLHDALPIWNPSADKGPSTFDVTHVFTLSLIQSLPLDRVGFLQPLGKKFTKGWQLLNITTLTSGPPFTIYSGVQQTGAGAGGTDRPDLLALP